MKLSLSDEHAEALRELAVSLGGHLALISKPKAADIFVLKMKGLVREIRALYKQLAREGSPRYYENHELELILDNFYIIEGASIEIERDFARKDIRKLPQIARASGRPIPRSYFILSEYLRFTNDSIDKTSLKLFLKLYQGRSPLSIRELDWLPFMFRVLLLEATRNEMRMALDTLSQFRQAEECYKEIEGELERKTDVGKITSRLAKEYGIIPTHFGLYLVDRLSDSGAGTRPLLKWLRLNLEKQGLGAEALVHRESGIRAAGAKNVGNIIDSLRWLNQIRWDLFVEEIDTIDRILAREAHASYILMDSRSRGLYRARIVELADASGILEAEIARTAVKLTDESQQKKSTDALAALRTHVGYYLLGKGRKILEEKISYRSPYREKISLFMKRYPGLIYFGLIGIILIGSIFFIIPLLVASVSGSPMMFWILIVMAISFFFGSEWALSIGNFVFMKIVKAERLPRLDLHRGVGNARRTFVVVPSMFRDEKSVEVLLRKIETYFLGNNDDNIYYALLLDFKDADAAELASDQRITGYLAGGIQRLNEKYPSKTARFYGLYRKRLWNSSERVFMGWERKRGKLREFNRLLRGAVDTSYGNADDIRTVGYVRYVITIDEDSELPIESASALVGCISHPLNTPILWGGSVIHGWGIIEPQITYRLSVAYKSLFSSLLSHAVGIDSYSAPIADVYQDLFGNGIFYGKGIYDIDVIEQTMGDSIPENKILSHDLLEGIYARVALASDVQVFDGFPSRYHEYAIRGARWIRGDWQIISWLWRRAVMNGKIIPRANFVDRWKICDNLRRSLTPIAVVGTVIVGALAQINSFAWYLLPIATLAAPFAPGFFFDLLRLNERESLYDKLRNSIRHSRNVLLQIILRICFSLHLSAIAADAIILSLYRMIVSKQNLLEWKSAHEVSASSRGTFIEMTSIMWLSPLVGMSLASTLFLLGTPIHWALFFWLSAWFFAPLVAYIVSIPQKSRSRLSRRSENFLRKLAVRTATFFLENAGKDFHFLIPDHVDERERVREERIATSPTNIGMMFTAWYASFRFGILSLSGLLRRTEMALESMEKLPRFRGHFYNWYDIRSLTVLPPKYISTVDSANLIAALIMFRSGLQKSLSEPIVSSDVGRGFRDLFSVILDEIKNITRRHLLTKKEKYALKNIASFLKLISKSINDIVLSNDVFCLSRSIKKTGEDMATLQVLRERLEIARSSRGDTADERRVAVHMNHVISLVNLCTLLFEESALFLKGLTGYAATLESLPLSCERQASLSSVKQILNDLISPIPSICSLADGELLKKFNEARFGELLRLADAAGEEKEDLRRWLLIFERSLVESQNEAREVRKKIEQVLSIAEKYIDSSRFDFLYNKERGLLHIGYNETQGVIDGSYYDFLASEANAASYLAIMKGHVEKKHWFFLSRKLVRTGGVAALASWGGSLFEYLTSLIFFDVHPESLLGKTASRSIREHMRYAKKNGIPWGMGESAQYEFDVAGNYQYQIHGVPSLGLKRGLEERLVVSPYTSALALPFAPLHAVRNLRRLVDEGAVGKYGFYDAVEYTKLSRGRKRDFAKIYYAHHQGFILAGIANLVFAGELQNLFKNDPRAESADILLEEKMPNMFATKIPKGVLQRFTAVKKTVDIGLDTKRYIPVKTDIPRYALISNGTYGVGISNAGGGWSRWNGVFLTRYRYDSTREDYGTYIKITDKKTSASWSPTLLPQKTFGKKSKVIFQENRAEFYKSNQDIDSILEIMVHDGDAVEFRRLTLFNNSKDSKEIIIETRGEVALSGEREWAQHPNYEMLFVSSEFISEESFLLFSRRSGKDRSKKIFFAHALVAGKNSQFLRALSHREDIVREQRYGINSAMPEARPLYNLDSAFSLSCSIRLDAGESEEVVAAFFAGGSREEVVRLVRKYRTLKAIDHVFMEQATHGRHIQSYALTPDQGKHYQDIASRLFEGGKDFRKSVVRGGGIHSLWRNGISGDRPLLVLAIADMERLQMLKQALAAQSYLAAKGVFFDVVVINDHPASYIRTLDDEVDFLIRSVRSQDVYASATGVYHVKSHVMIEGDRDMIVQLAAIAFDAAGGSFVARPEAFRVARELSEKINPSKKPYARRGYLKRPRGLMFDNGYGGFSGDGSVYTIYTDENIKTPQPWVNIIANEHFGTIVTESGGAYTWAKDSYDNRLTSRISDPVRFETSEALFLRDNQTLDYWSLAPEPNTDRAPYITTHGRGYSSFQHRRALVNTEFSQFLAPSSAAAASKILRVKINNESQTKRTFSLIAYFELELATDRFGSHGKLNIEYDNSIRAFFFSNYFRNNFSSRRAFLWSSESDISYTGSKLEFLGRHASLAESAGLNQRKLSNDFGRTSDNIFALEQEFALGPKEEKIVYLFFGDATSVHDGASYLNESAVPEKIESDYQRLLDDQPLSVFIKTPDRALDILFNKWLLYQVDSARFLGKTGFYQPSGAYGFRDQLQDSLAFIYTNPEKTRAMILRAAVHQFEEGDVMTWWHDHNNFGHRSALTDQQLWLPYTILKYVGITGDDALWKHTLPFLVGEQVDFGTKEHWTGVGTSTDASYTLFEHALRAIQKNLVFGSHGLPLIGLGDWNDGLSRVGAEGKGESVWLAWFLIYILDRFIPVAEKENYESARMLADALTNLRIAVEKHGWDGEWYRRAYLDSGTPIGSRALDEYKIDSVAQSWAAIAGGDAVRVKKALSFAWKKLEENGEVRLIAPPLAESGIDPGYLRDYPPGVRENGAQYNHAALWLAEAFFSTGDAQKGMKILESVNPILRSGTSHKAERYRVEPYVVASDIYAAPSYPGRGGWTWYTGSAGVMYRIIIESLFGIKKTADTLELVPNVPNSWDECSIAIPHKNATYTISIRRSADRNAKPYTLCDGELVSGPIRLHANGQHSIEVFLSK